MKGLQLKIRTKILLMLFLGLAFLAGAFSVMVYLKESKSYEQIITKILMQKLQDDLEYSLLSTEKTYGRLQYTQEGGLSDASGKSLRNDFSMVDEWNKKLNVVATFFEVEGEDYKRVSTNIRKDDGSRVIGTTLGTQSAAYDPIQKGERYLGKASILGKSYLTVYEPIKDAAGKVSAFCF